MTVRIDDPTESHPPVGRRERRRAATLQRLLAAGEAVLGRSGLDAPIADITEAADTGFGTFYSYFDSKDALVRSVIDEQLAALSRRSRALAAGVTDPAEVLARKLALRLMIGLAQPTWAAFHVTALAEPTTEMAERITRNFARDIDAGVRGGRFRADLVDSGVMFVVAGHAAALQRIASSATPGPDPADVVAQSLVVLGLDRGEAVDIAAAAAEAAADEVRRASESSRASGLEGS